MGKSWMSACWKLFAAAALAATAMNAAAQGYPNRTVTFIWPFAGATPNAEAFRVLADEAGKVLGRPMVTDFRPGAGSRLGVQAVMNAPGDGYLVAAALDTIFSALPLMSGSFKPELGKNYSPIVAPVDSTPVLTSHPSLPFRDLKGMIAYAKANPGKLTGGSPGIGSWAHLTFEVIMAEAGGIDITQVPYKSSALALPDRFSGRVSMYISGPDTAVPFMQAGKLVGLAVIHPKRLEGAPDMPTLAEAGLPKASLRNWVGIVAPAGTPQDVVMKLNAAFNAALKKPETVKAMQVGGWLVSHGTTPEVFAQYVKSDLATWGPIVRRLGLKTD